LVIDEPTELPEGTVVDLAVVDAGDELGEAERFLLHDALADSWDQARRGELVLPKTF